MQEKLETDQPTNRHTGHGLRMLDKAFLTKSQTFGPIDPCNRPSVQLCHAT